MTKQTDLERFMKNHREWCRTHEYSLGDKRYCSCGKEGAENEIAELRRQLEEEKALSLKYQTRNDELFFAGEGLILDLCKILGLDYESSGKAEIVDRITQLKLLLEECRPFVQDMVGIASGARLVMQSIEEFLGQK